MGQEVTRRGRWDMKTGTMVTACAQASQAYGYDYVLVIKAVLPVYGDILSTFEPGRNVHTLDTAHSPPPLDESL